MQEQSDAQLLRAHLQGDESAFREIVGRHADLVYSAALRQLNSPALAQDIAQNVFVDLVRKSREVSARMANDASLAGWLYRSTRFAVLNHLRDEQRRAEHERQAMEQLITDTSPAADWERIRPMLDEAMAELSDDDRDAVLLRYFKNQDFRTVGRALGLSDDAAQKRVSRAVERLRDFFSKRGVAIGAGGLVVVISANAVNAAPAALAGTIFSTAVLAGTAHASTAITATKVIAMTTLQKTLVTATILVLAGASVYEARQVHQLDEKANQQTPLTEQTRQLGQQNNELSQKLAALEDENARLKRDTAELLKLRAEVGSLRQATNELAKVQTKTPEPSQPPAPKPKTDDEILRMVKDKQNFARAWMTAFKNYASNHSGALPNNFEDAKGFFPAEVGYWPDISPDDFEILYHGSLNAITNRETIVFREKKLWQHIGGKWGRFDVLANGYAQYGSVPPGFSDSDFTDWEKQRIVSPTDQ
jgi:RNA polymerase sigma factor (sigma-70 family)